MSGGRRDEAVELQVNAWTGSVEASRGELSAGARDWALREVAAPAGQHLVAEDPADPRDWRDDRVGWGLITADNDAVSAGDRAAGSDLPASLQSLVADRSAQIFRYREDSGVAFLTVYEAGGEGRKIGTAGAGRRGRGVGRLPRYLLIHGPPSAVPWGLQYALNTVAYVGRLDLPEDALDRYVKAMVHDWAGSNADFRRPLVWTVDYGKPDITWLMRHAVAEPVARRFASDPDLADGVTRLAESEATGAALAGALATQRPGVIVTTSHGMVSAESLGFLVDQDEAMVAPGTLLASWQPDGAIWYAHACCSAGSDGEDRYAGLVKSGSPLEETLRGVAALGPHTALLATALLSAQQPLRAFVGHVEPTFNWTLRDPENGEVLASGLEEALHGGLYREQPEPVGLALGRHFEPVGALLTEWREERRLAGQATTAERRTRARAIALRHQLTALDRQGMVILGDPTACAPAMIPSR